MNYSISIQNADLTYSSTNAENTLFRSLTLYQIFTEKKSEKLCTYIY